MLQSGLIMKWKTVIIYLQTALLSTPMTVPAQMYWPAENECTASARGGISPTAIVTVSDMQVSAGYRVLRGAVQGVATNTVQGSFALLVAGILLSFAVLAVELCCSKGTGGSKAGLGNTFAP